MPFLYLAMAVLTSGYSGLCYKRVSPASGNRPASLLLPLLWFLPLTLIFGLCALCTGGIDSRTGVLLPALLAGVAAVVCGYALLESMKSNTYSLAIIIVNLSFVFPVLLSLLFLNEAVHVLQLVGMVLAVVVILLLNRGKGEGQSTVSALLLAVFSSLGNGLIDFAIKIQQHNTLGEGTPSFFFFTYLFAAVCSGGSYLVLHGLGYRARVRAEYKRALFINAPGIALCNGVCFFCISLLTGWMNAAAEFTVITSLSIIVSLAVGWFRLKEGLGRREILSLVFCAAAIACQYLNLL